MTWFLNARALIDLPVDSNGGFDCPKVKASVHLPVDVISNIEWYEGLESRSISFVERKGSGYFIS